MKTFRQIFILLFSLAITGCQDYTPFWGDEYKELKPESEYFDFSTVKEVSLNVNYGKRGSRALVEVYTEDPSYIGTDGETYYKDDAVFRAFCDENGHFDGKITLPSYANKVWVYTMRTGLPQMVKAAVNSGGIITVGATGSEEGDDVEDDEDEDDGGEGGSGTGTPSDGVIDPGKPKGYSEEARTRDAFRVVNPDNTYADKTTNKI